MNPDKFIYFHKKLGTFILIFLTVYLLTGISLWLFSIYSSGHEMRKPTSRYVDNHRQELRNSLFGSIFADARRCPNFEKATEQEQCEKEITYRMAILIKEEEFLNEHKYGWPHDLFFVKQEATNFYRLGWDGHIVNITETVDKDLVDNRTPFTFRVLAHQCHIFDATLDWMPDCQIFERIDLGNSDTGYVVRRVGVGSENYDFMFYTVFPPLIVLALLRGNFDSVILLMLAIFIITPLIITTIIMKTLSWYQRRKTHGT